MRHEKIIKRDDGSRVEIAINFWENSDKPVYDVSLQVCDAGKRKFRRIETDDYQYRALSMDDRKKYMLKIFLEYVSAEEIQQAKLELWYKLKPKSLPPIGY
jgi:hypothetical protein